MHFVGWLFKVICLTSWRWLNNNLLLFVLICMFMQLNAAFILFLIFSFLAREIFFSLEFLSQIRLRDEPDHHGILATLTFSPCTFSSGHCVVCSSSICEFWLPLWHLQTLLSVILCDENIIFYPLGSRNYKK